MFQANINQQWKYFQIFHLTFFQVYPSQPPQWQIHPSKRRKSYLSTWTDCKRRELQRALVWAVAVSFQTGFIASFRVSLLKVSYGSQCQWAVIRALFLRSAQAGTSEGFLVQDPYGPCMVVCMEGALHRVGDFLPVILGIAWYIGICTFSQCQLQLAVKFI